MSHDRNQSRENPNVEEELPGCVIHIHEEADESVEDDKEEVHDCREKEADDWCMVECNLASKQKRSQQRADTVGRKNSHKPL